MDDDDKIIMLGIICLECNSVIDVLSNDKEILYTDKACKCGSIGFYTIKIKIKVLTERPSGREPFFEWDGEAFYEGHE